MKNLIYAITILLASIGVGCNRNHYGQSIRVKDTNDLYTYTAVYPEKKGEKLTKYMDSVLSRKLVLNDHLDLMLRLNNGEKFNLKASTGVLEITFDKEDGSLEGYLRVKKIAEGVSTVLAEN